MTINNKIVVALGYFSVLITPVILPLIIWVVASDKSVKKHALRATTWQAIPFLTGIMLLILVGIIGFINNNGYQLSMLAIVLIGVTFLASFIFLIMNLVAGVKVLLD